MNGIKNLKKFLIPPQRDGYRKEKNITKLASIII